MKRSSRASSRAATRAPAERGARGDDLRVGAGEAGDGAAAARGALGGVAHDGGDGVDAPLHEHHSVPAVRGDGDDGAGRRRARRRRCRAAARRDRRAQRGGVAAQKHRAIGVGDEEALELRFVAGAELRDRSHASGMAEAAWAFKDHVSACGVGRGVRDLRRRAAVDAHGARAARWASVLEVPDARADRGASAGSGVSGAWQRGRC